MELRLTSDKSSDSEPQDDISVSATPKRRRKRGYAATKAKNRAVMKRREDVEYRTLENEKKRDIVRFLTLCVLCVSLLYLF